MHAQAWLILFVLIMFVLGLSVDGLYDVFWMSK